MCWWREGPGLVCPGVPYHRCVLEISYQLSRRSIAPTANTATMPANIAESLPHVAAQLPPANMELVTHPLLLMQSKYQYYMEDCVSLLLLLCVESSYETVCNCPCLSSTKTKASYVSPCSYDPMCVCVAPVMCLH